ncbi:DUF1674 domain containing protein [Nitzschia inconspicua]|nr:DUF1674 domain containing protein [Nitzschia inconspicua]
MTSSKSHHWRITPRCCPTLPNASNRYLSQTPAPGPAGTTASTESMVEDYKRTKNSTTATTAMASEQDNVVKVGEKVVKEACGADTSKDGHDDDDDDEMEQEEMFVEAHSTFKHKQMEWGGPRRGGRLPEPTRFGDWERKGRCTDF